MAQIYHGCMTKNADGTNGIIGPGEKFLVPTDECFGKILDTLRNVRLKQEAVPKRNLLWALRTMAIICNKRNGPITGF